MLFYSASWKPINWGVVVEKLNKFCKELQIEFNSDTTESLIKLLELREWRKKMEFEEASAKMKAIVGDISSIENLIDEIVDNMAVKNLVAEIEQIIKGQEPVKNLLGFIPMVARLSYNLIEKDGTRGAEIEKMVKVVIGLLESKMA